MVTEAHRKSSQCLDVAVRTVAHLATLTNQPLAAPEPGAQAIGKVARTHRRTDRH